MKQNKNMETSLARKFRILTFIIILAFSSLITILMVYQNALTEEFERKNLRIAEKQKLTSELNASFNLAISEMRGYLAFGKDSYYTKVEDQRKIVLAKLDELRNFVENEEDELFIRDTKNFYGYYFLDRLPRTKESYDQGNIEEVKNIANTATHKIRVFQASLKQYSNRLEERHNTNHVQLERNFFFSQVVFASALFILITGMGIFTRIMLARLGKPLRKLTIAAGEIADGKTVIFTDTTKGKDELGLLSKAFEKMSRSIQEKEQDLSAQNEELLAQKDELQSQQCELKEALEAIQSSELDLKRRNDLINGISNSLDKKEVLTSIVKTMCGVISADKGIIVLLDRDRESASFGISEQGVYQFIENLHAGSIVRLKETKKPYIIRRESMLSEKAFHTSTCYTYDLYLPVLSASGNIEAVMVYSRFDKSFADSEISEYDSLSKQIAISLDKLKLYEQSEAERLLTQDILDTIKAGIQLVDITGKVIQVNQKLCDMMNCKSSNFIQRQYKKWIEELIGTVDNGQELKRFFDCSLLNSKADQFSFIYHQHSPVRRVVRVYCEPLTRDGEKIGTVIVHRDITKEHEVDVMKSEFVSTVSHELRTPLASVLGFTELMLNKDLKPDRQKKYLTTIYQEAKRLTSLINDFLDVQRMEAGKQIYDKKYDDILPLLENIIETYELNHQQHRFHFEVQTKNTMVLGDKDKISQVFTNLISNAIKYSPDGGDIFVTVYEEETNLKISIKDEGLGIPEDAIDKLFEKFFRVDNSDRRRIGGTGLGLAIVKEIIKAHNGDITVESVLKEGSTFTVSFPLVIGITEHKAVSTK